MRKALCLILLTAIASAFAQVRPTEPELAKLSAAIIAQIDTDKPIFLDVRAGDWSPALTSEIEIQLLKRGDEIRRVKSGDQLPANSISDTLVTAEKDFDLGDYALKEAVLLQVDMELEWQTLEHRSFISYSSERKPLYVFTIRQILLPGHKLEKVGSTQYQFSADKGSAITSSGIKWFEPMLATAALASIIYLLWTTE